MFKDKKILIIGGTGTIGSNLVKLLLKETPTVIRILSRDEFKQYNMSIELAEHKNIRFLLGDIRDYERTKRAMEDIDIVFHAAALKQVPACEYNPFEAVKTNVLGTQNVIDAAMNQGVQKMIFTSTDKTISPTNTYGATKLLAERLICAAEYSKGNKQISFSAVRFGNVMGSRGSVVPLFVKQILENGYITVTDGSMSRFMMTQSQAARLLLEACQKANGGEVFILKMPVINIMDLAEVVVEETAKKFGFNPKNIEIRTIGLRPGEKMYEELMTEEESEQAIEFDNMFAIQSQLSKSREYSDGKEAVKKTYSSHDVMPISKQEIKDFLYEERLI